MNLVRATIFALLPTTVLAAGFTGPAGENKLGEEVSVVEGFVDKQGDFQSFFSLLCRNVQASRMETVSG